MQEHVDITFDTDVALKAYKYGARRSRSQPDVLAKALHSLGYSMADILSLSPMNSLATVAAASAAMTLKKADASRGVPQQVASVFAAAAASSAAITGDLSGDARVVNTIKAGLVKIFECHGAIELNAPLLRPRHPVRNPPDTAGGPAELLNQRGSVLLLPEDLTVGFARSVARSGGGATRLKRYAVGNTFLKSLAGGHPRETLDASFDIVQPADDRPTKPQIFEAELIVVLCTALTSLPNRWFLRVTHTRLVDSIFELCGIHGEGGRRAILQILTEFTAPPPFQQVSLGSPPENGANKSSDFVKYLDVVVKKHGVSKVAVDRLRTIFDACLPLSNDAERALASITAGLRSIDAKQDFVSTRPFNNHLKNCLSCIQQLRSTIGAMHGLGIRADDASKPHPEPQLSLPISIVIDLGLRQKRRHIHGHFLFQAITVPGECDENNLKAFLANGRGIKIAEGGRYDDLVRHFRPPGLGSISTPICAGIRFSLKHWVELASSCSTFPVASNLQTCFGYTLPKVQPCKVLIASANGMDSTSAGERALVAAKLWKAGVACDYLPNTGVVAGLGSLTLDQLCSVSFILGIPYIVILSKKGAVRLRHNLSDQNEEFVSVEDLPGLIRNRLESDVTADMEHSTTSTQLKSLEHPTRGRSTGSLHIKVDCIYVDEDQFYPGIKGKPGQDRKPKSVRKTQSSATQKAEAYIKNLADSRGDGTPLIASELQFWILREFGTCVMMREEHSSIAASNEIAEKYPQHKRVLKTLAMAIDYIMRQHGEAGEGLVDLMMYSIPDDRFDLIGVRGGIGKLAKPPSTSDRRNRSIASDTPQRAPSGKKDKGVRRHQK